MKKRRLLKIALISGVIALPLWAVISSDAVSSKSAQVLSDLKGFYVGLGVGSTSLFSGAKVNSLDMGAPGSAKPNLNTTGLSLTGSVGYEKKFAEDYIFGIEGTYAHINATASGLSNLPAGGGVGGTYASKDSIKLKDTYGVNFSLGRQFDRITPYVKLGLVSSRFDLQSSAPTSQVEGSQSVRRFGLAPGIGMKYALSEQLDFVTEAQAILYKALTSNNFSTLAGDAQSITISPWVFSILMGLRFKF